MSAIITEYKELPIKIEKAMSKDLIKYESSHGIDVNYRKGHIVFSDNTNDTIYGVLSYYTCFSEVYIDDIWVSDKYRGQGFGKQLLHELEKKFSGQGFNNINCVTSHFQAPEFYKKCGFSLEFTRINNKNPKLTKYFFVKFFNEDTETQGLISD